MSLSPAQQAVQWLEQQLTDLSGIRNATPRDPSFKNWRQATLTTMQRIWPADQDRQERFRRIPFSPADPRADARTVREWYARGCQEAARVLSGFIKDIRAEGVPAPADDVASKPSSGEFGVDFPTVDLPSGDLGASVMLPGESDDILRDLGPPSGETPRVPTFQGPPAPHPPLQAPSVFAPAASVPAPQPVVKPAPPAPAPAPVAQQAIVQTRPSKKGVGARLRDLLGFAQLSAKAFTAPPREPSPIPPPTAAPAPLPTSFGLDMIPVGDEVTPTRPTSVVPNAPAPPRAPEASSAPPAVAAHAPTAPPALGEGSAPPSGEEMREPGMSVVMSRPTTLRANIEKVSIESLISPEFRANEPQAAAAKPDPLARPHLTPPTLAVPTPEVAAAAPKPEVAPPPVVAPKPEVAPAPVATPKPALEAVAPVVDLGPKADLVIPPAPKPSAKAAAPTPSQSMPMPTPSQSMSMPTPSSASIPAPTPSQSMPMPTPSSASLPAPTPSQSMPAPSRADLPFAQPSAVIPMPSLPNVPGADAESAVDAVEPPAAPAAARENPSKVLPLPKRVKPVAKKPDLEDLVETEDHISAEMPVDPEEFAQATEDFMRSSPVLGATGRKVKRGYDEQEHEKSGFDDPDAIAVASIMDELTTFGVPSARHPEARARLLDLARRLEKGELEWAALRKAVWFAMEYPELARRLMPMLLPWIDRAA